MNKIEDIALAEVGVRDDGKNGGEAFKRYALPGEQALPWCARFVRWCCEKAGEKLPGNRYQNAAVVHLAQSMTDAGTFRVSCPGAPCIIFYHNRGRSDVGPGRHVGLVVRSARDHLETVEGNWCDKVSRRVVRRDDPAIAGFGVLAATRAGDTE